MKDEEVKVTLPNAVSQYGFTRLNRVSGGIMNPHAARDFLPYIHGINRCCEVYQNQ